MPHFIVVKNKVKFYDTYMPLIHYSILHITQTFCWRANMDIPFINDANGAACYVISYRVHCYANAYVFK